MISLQNPPFLNYSTDQDQRDVNFNSSHREVNAFNTRLDRVHVAKSVPKRVTERVAKHVAKCVTKRVAKRVAKRVSVSISLVREL